MGDLEGIKSITLAECYNLDAKPSMIRSEIKKVVLEYLVDEDILSDLALALLIEKQSGSFKLKILKM